MRVTLSCLFLCLVFLPGAAAAEELATILQNVEKFVTENNYPKAMKELQWAENEIQKLHVAKLESFLPETLEGYQGTKVQANSALGMTQIERNYDNGSSKVKLSLMGGSGGGNNPLGGLAAMGQMAAMMGGSQPGVETFRLKGRTANLTARENSRRAELTVFLDSGSMLKFEATTGKDVDTEKVAEVLKKMAEGVNLDGLDNYLKGMS